MESLMCLVVCAAMILTSYIVPFFLNHFGSFLFSGFHYIVVIIIAIIISIISIIVLFCLLYSLIDKEFREFLKDFLTEFKKQLITCIVELIFFFLNFKKRFTNFFHNSAFLKLKKWLKEQIVSFFSFDNLLRYFLVIALISIAGCLFYLNHKRSLKPKPPQTYWKYKIKENVIAPPFVCKANKFYTFQSEHGFEKFYIYSKDTFRAKCDGPGGIKTFSISFPENTTLEICCGVSGTFVKTGKLEIWEECQNGKQLVLVTLDKYWGTNLNIESGMCISIPKQEESYYLEFCKNGNLKHKILVDKEKGKGGEHYYLTFDPDYELRFKAGYTPFLMIPPSRHFPSRVINKEKYGLYCLATTDKYSNGGQDFNVQRGMRFCIPKQKEAYYLGYFKGGKFVSEMFITGENRWDDFDFFDFWDEYDLKFKAAEVPFFMEFNSDPYMPGLTVNIWNGTHGIYGVLDNERKINFENAYILNNELKETPFWLDNSDFISLIYRKRDNGYFHCYVGGKQQKFEGSSNRWYWYEEKRSGYIKSWLYTNKEGYLKFKGKDCVIEDIGIAHHSGWKLKLKENEIKNIKIYPGDKIQSYSTARYYVDGKLLEGNQIYTHVSPTEKYLQFKRSVNLEEIIVWVVSRRGY